jgi:hypothetical protein
MWIDASWFLFLKVKKAEHKAFKGNRILQEDLDLKDKATGSWNNACSTFWNLSQQSVRLIAME